MDIKEVLNLPNGTEVISKGITYTVQKGCGEKVIIDNKTCSSAFLTSETLNADYELVRKKLNFFEAMRLVDEGKVVESFNGYIFKKDTDGCIVCKEKGNPKKIFGSTYICRDEIANDWYEVIE